MFKALIHYLVPPDISLFTDYSRCLHFEIYVIGGILSGGVTINAKTICVVGGSVAACANKK